MINPLVSLCISFSLGILAAAYFKISFFIFCSLALISLILSIISIEKSVKFNVFILSLAFFLGAAALKNSEILPNCHIAKLIPQKKESIFLTGVIDSDPIYKARGASFILKTEKLKINETWLRASGKVLVRSSIKDKFSYGDRLLLEGGLYRPFSFSEGFNYRDYLRHRGIYLILSVKKGSVVRQLDKNAGNPVMSLAFRMRHKMKDVLVKNLSPFSTGILNAIILGDRQNLPAYVRDVLVKSGTVHIIAISGLHLGIVAFMILLIFEIIKIPRKPRYILTILLLIFYCVLTGANPPVVRATIMAVIFLLSYFLKRKVNIYSSLSLAALIILAFNPWQIFEISFQLSFLSVISIVSLAPKIKNVFPAKANKIPFLRFLILTFSVSLAAWLGLLPLIAYYFRIFTPISVLANMVIVPYSALITASGFSLGVVGMFAPSLAHIFGITSELLIVGLFKLNSFFVSIPGAYFKLPRFSFIYALFYYAVLCMSLRAPRSGAKQSH